MNRDVPGIVYGQDFEQVLVQRIKVARADWRRNYASRSRRMRIING